MNRQKADFNKGDYKYHRSHTYGRSGLFLRCLLCPTLRSIVQQSVRPHAYPVYE